MKNFCIIFLSIVILSVTALGFSGKFPKGKNSVEVGGEYLRIHIRANSNDGEEQAVKYDVRDEVVAYLTPLVAEYESKKEALEGIKTQLTEIEKKATRVLKERGFSYAATATLTVEYFPTRVYGEYVLPAGEYSALILRLGSGEGDNWWCVVYPPLCFSGGNGNVIYKSKIKEIIDKFFN